MCAEEVKRRMEGEKQGEYDGDEKRKEEYNPSNPDIQSTKPGWFDPQHGMPPWNPQQPVSVIFNHKEPNVLAVTESTH